MHVQQYYRILRNRSFKGLNRELLLNDLSSTDWCLIIKLNDLHDQVSAFTSAFLKVWDVHAPVIQRRAPFALHRG